MATVQQQASSQGGAWYHFVRSTWVTWVTEWVLTFGGKSAHIVLTFTTLYMSAELYPGVSFPSALNLVVFLVQMFALDMGGMGLASIARQAKADGDSEGARKAQRLSNWLIGIMIAGIVTVCLEQALANSVKSIPVWVDDVKVVIELALVIGRSFCAVLYGVTIHSLKQHTQVHHSQADYRQVIDDLRVQIQSEMQASLSAFQTQIVKQIPTIEPVNYETILQQLLPAIESKMREFETAISTQIPQPVNLAELASEVAVLLPNRELNGRTSLPGEQEDMGELDREVQRELDREQQGEVAVPLHIVPRQAKEGTQTGNSRGNSEATKMIHRLLKKNSSLGPTELAEKAGCSKRYASQVKQRYLASQHVS